jgi:hypothetical protein
LLARVRARDRNGWRSVPFTGSEIALRAAIIRELRTLEYPNKPKKAGRPKLPKAEAKGRIVPVRFTEKDLKAIAAAAKANNQNVSEWIRCTIRAMVEL